MLTRGDERPPLEQVKSGFRIVGAMLLCLAAFLLFSKGYTLLTARHDAQATVGWILLATTGGTLFLTVGPLGPDFLRGRGILCGALYSARSYRPSRYGSRHITVGGGGAECMPVGNDSFQLSLPRTEDFCHR